MVITPVLLAVFVAVLLVVGSAWSKYRQSAAWRGAGAALGLDMTRSRLGLIPRPMLVGSVSGFPVRVEVEPEANADEYVGGGTVYRVEHGVALPDLVLRRRGPGSRLRRAINGRLDRGIGDRNMDSVMVLERGDRAAVAEALSEPARREIVDAFRDQKRGHIDAAEVVVRTTHIPQSAAELIDTTQLLVRVASALAAQPSPPLTKPPIEIVTARRKSTATRNRTQAPRIG